MTILYALGWTQHSIGSQIIRTGAMVQLLLGNIGMAGGGMNALRGHSNIQGLTDLGLLSDLLPGYLTLPAGRAGLRRLHRQAHAKPLRPTSCRTGRTTQVPRQPDETWWGDAATAENNWASTTCPSSTSRTTCCRRSS
jgi:formate dehydrogenase major subunit